jgi:hypothetical protein
MPRLSLWNPKKGNDYRFIDNLVRAHFHHGGTGVFVHKYLGVHSQDGVPDESEIPETTIQDLLFLENRDRKYDDAIYDLRGQYNLQDSDFDLSQFGVFLTNDTMFMTFHINEMIEIVGRRLIPGDVLELPHLLDDTALDNSTPIRKFYTIEDASKDTNGYDPGWWPHIWRVKAVPIQDTQEYRDILGDADDPDSLKNLMSTYQKEIAISDSIIAEAEAAVPSRGVNVAHLYIDENSAQVGIYGHDGIPTNGNPVNSGTTFPVDAVEDDYFLRTDYTPNRLFQKCGNRWIKIEDDLTGKWSAASRLIDSFINNDSTFTQADGSVVPVKQSLSQAIKPKTDI